MTQFLPILKQTTLFAGVGDEEITALLCCLNATKRDYPKGAYILRQGDHVSDILLTVRGTLHIQSEDHWGNRHILRHISVGETFGEAYAAPHSGALLSDAVAAEDCTVLFFDVRRLLTTCSSACRFHAQVVQNLVFALSEKNRALVQKLGYMSRRTTRDKLTAYLSEQAKARHSACFVIPFNRQQLSDYLSVDRSAMSAELGRMRDEGLLRFEKNRFELLGGTEDAHC